LSQPDLKSLTNHFQSSLSFCAEKYKSPSIGISQLL
jgi:hypothetical protein